MAVTHNKTIAPGQSAGAASSLAIVGAVVTTIANFAIAYLVSRESAAFAGVFFIATAIITILGNSASLGTMTGLVYFMPVHLGDEGAGPRSLITMALRPVVIASTVAAAALFLIASPVANLVAAERADDVTSMLRILAVAVVPWALTVSVLGATRSLGSHVPTVLVSQVVRPGLQLLALGVLLLRGDPSIWAVGLAWTVPVFIGAVLAFGYVGRLGGWATTDGTATSSSEFWAYTRPRAFSTALQIALERFDVVLVGAFVGLNAAGVYGALTRFITAGNFLMYSVAQAVSPGLRRAIASENWHKARQTLQKATGWLVLIAWPYFIAVSLKPEPLARLMSPEYVDDASILGLLAIGMMFSALSGPIELTLLMLGRSSLALVGIAVAIVTDVVLLIVLTPSLGLAGAAIAWSVSVAMQNLINAWFVRSETTERADRFLVAPSMRAVVAGAIAIAAVVPIALVTPQSFVGLIIVGVVGGVLTIGLALATREKLAIRELLPV